MKVYVRSFDVSLQHIYWEIDNPERYEFTLYRSESPGGPFILLAEDIVDKTHFADTFIIPGRFTRKYYYKVFAKHIDTGQIEEEIGYLVDYPPKEAIEIARQFRFALESLLGVKCFYLPRKTFGTKCSCVSVFAGTRQKSHCSTCFDTAFIGGYYNPIVMYAQINSAPVDVQVSFNVIENQMALAKIPNYPLVTPNSYLVDPQNRRWRCLKVDIASGEIMGFPTYQQVNLILEESSHIIYTFPIKEENLETFEPYKETAKRRRMTL